MQKKNSKSYTSFWFSCFSLLFATWLISYIYYFISFVYSEFHLFSFFQVTSETKFIYLRLFFPKVGIYCHKLTSKFTYYLTLISIYDTFWYVVCSVQNTFHFLFGFSFWPMDYLELLLSFKCLGIFQLSFYYWFQTIILWSENKICLTWIFCSLLHVWPTRWS